MGFFIRRFRAESKLNVMVSGGFCVSSPLPLCAMNPINIANTSQAPEVNVHLLPIKIARNGKANVSKFFLIEEEKEFLLKGVSHCVLVLIDSPAGQPTLKTNFRGRQLRGAKQKVPAGYTGYVFRQDDEDFGVCFWLVSLNIQVFPYDIEEKHTEQWSVTGFFSEFTYWHREDAPTDGDSVQTWMNWFNLSKAINQPLDAEVWFRIILPILNPFLFFFCFYFDAFYIFS